jgi:hypothetical protein
MESTDAESSLVLIFFAFIVSFAIASTSVMLKDAIYPDSDCSGKKLKSYIEKTTGRYK